MGISQAESLGLFLSSFCHLVRCVALLQEAAAIGEYWCSVTNSV